MRQKSQNKKIILGLKVRKLRQDLKLSFQDLSKSSGLSVSYLNEIEKGKKYPREDKVVLLAKALGTTPENLVSYELPQDLSPLSDLLRSNFLNELPLDLFGIEKPKVIEIIANAPTKVSAFISALIEISRKYELQQEHFYFSALRSYQELKSNYFEEIEEAVEQLAKDQKIPTDSHVPIEHLFRVLQQEYRYKINGQAMSEYPLLKDMRSVYLQKKRTLLINNELTDKQKAFQLGKEIGYSYLKLKDRVYTSTFLRIKNFDEVLNNFKASYFSVALLINRDSLLSDIRNFFSKPTWNASLFQEMMDKYQASPEMFLQRLSNILPTFFGIKSMFFLRFETKNNSEKYYITKELHLAHPHHPHGNETEEHYCRRWVSLWLLRDLNRVQEQGKYNKPIIGVQRSRFFGTRDEYLCFTIARPGYPTPNVNISITLGLLINEDVMKKISFLNDPSIMNRQVHTTCERCEIEDCRDRVAPPVFVNRDQRTNEIQNLLKKITTKL